MFGTRNSKTIAAFASAAVLASTLIASGALAASAGNSFEIPPLKDAKAYYAPPTYSTTQQQQPSVVERSTTNSSCPGGYTWTDSMAGNGMSIPTRCR